MILTCLAEIGGIYVKHSVPGVLTRNEWLYNLLLPFQAGLMTWMFYDLLRDYLPMRWLVAAFALTLFGLYVEELREHGLIVYNQMTNSVLLISISLYSLLYYYFLIRDPKYLNLMRHADFWWVTGIFFFYFGTTACNIFYHRLAPHANDFIKNLTYYIYNAFIFVLYGCWSYAFICKKWQARTLQA
ncbi:hypothetical protein [Mucilaginibacter sp. 3215]|uniref:hypothetical protein n=1 Tax=Mucilaginibacter sp. 3215 TaxID=3373912 RepID=UPI003D1E0E2B